MSSFAPRAVLVAAVAATATFPLLPAQAHIASDPAGTDAGPAAQVNLDATVLATSPALSGAADRYVVRLAPTTNLTAASAALRNEGVVVEETYRAALKAAVVTGTAAEAAAIADLPGVTAVTPDRVVRASAESWGLDRVDQRTLPLDDQYTANGSGAGVDVYVMDTGVRADHYDFGDRVRPGATTINDGRGSGDCNGHGTHVAGTVGGMYFGVANQSTLIPVRVLGCNGEGSLSDVLAGLDWVVQQHAPGTPAVLNMSLGSEVEPIVDEAVRAVIDDGVTVVLAAGNEAKDACQVSPARVPAALTVAATDQNDQQAGFSNFGTCVDLYAPGVAITSTWHTGPDMIADVSGTSMAAPHVAGAAAALLSIEPGLSPAQVNSRVLDNATVGQVRAASTGTPNRVLFTGPAGTAQPPTVPTATKPGKGQVTSIKGKSRSVYVTWKRAADGGTALTKQHVVIYLNGSKVRTVGVAGSATKATVKNLKPGAGYSVRVIAQNKVGMGAASASSAKVKVLR